MHQEEWFWLSVGRRSGKDTGMGHPDELSARSELGPGSIPNVLIPELLLSLGPGAAISMQHYLTFVYAVV